MTVAASEPATRLSPGGASAGITQRTPAPGGAAPPSSGWLTSSDSISHGRFAPGALFDARYRIIGLLGRGGMGEVYRADDMRLGQPVALKLLPEDLRHDSVRLAQFHNEVRTARQVSHPNVCRVYDIGEADGVLYLSMEYVDGEDLATSLRRIGRFPEDKARRHRAAVVRGLAAAHQSGVIHRDLKPANVMLDGAGRVRVMDFGLAAVGRVEDVRAGTPAYMAPEQLLGHERHCAQRYFCPRPRDVRALHRASSLQRVDDWRAGQSARDAIDDAALGDCQCHGPGVERAIFGVSRPIPIVVPRLRSRCRRPCPGGDPLAAALAAGETPSPEMVAAAGEGAGLSSRIAWPVYLSVLVGIAASFVMALRTSPLDLMRPEYTSDVLAQKARDVIRQLGYADASGGRSLRLPMERRVREARAVDRQAVPRWKEVLVQRPSPLEFWYRQSP